MELVDTHCHIHFDDYPLDAKEVLQEAASARVTKLICVGCSLKDSRLAVGFAGKHKNVWASVGAHPHDGSDFLTIPNASEELRNLLNKPKVVAIGEIGLDYYHAHTPKADQKKALRQQIEVGLGTELPFIFHVRDAWEDFWPIIDDYNIPNAVVHSFSAHQSQLDEVLKRGFYVGLNGIMTFTKDDSQLEAAKKVPVDKMLLETDAPFLTPAPLRGKPCQPKHVALTAEFLAELRNESVEELAKATSTNATKLFGI